MTMSPTRTTGEPQTRNFEAIGTTAVVAVVDPHKADDAERILREQLEAVDVACSRFRADSELSALNRCGGEERIVSLLLFEAIRVALEVAHATGGAVDPTVGQALATIGYDRDFDEVVKNETPLEQSAQPVSGWELVELDLRRRSVRTAPGIQLDLGASAKALVADTAAARIAEQHRCGVLVSIGGDVAVAGEAPDGGWAIGIAVDCPRRAFLAERTAD